MLGGKAGSDSMAKLHGGNGMTSDYDHQRILDRLDSLDKRFGHIIAYVKQLEARIEKLERRGDETPAQVERG